MQSQKHLGVQAHITRRTNQQHRRRLVETGRCVAAAVHKLIERLEPRVLLSTTTIDHSAVNATTGGFPASGTDLTLNAGSGMGISVGATTTNTTPITNVLQLTDAMNGENNSAFAKTVQGVDNFHTTFDFTYGNANPPGADGFTFVLQNDPGADMAVFGGGSNLAYGGMTNSVAVKFDLWDQDNGSQADYTATGVYVNGDFPSDLPRLNPSSKAIVVTPGTEPTVDLSKNPNGSDSGMDFHGNPDDIYHVDLNYDGTTLTETVTDTTRSITETQKYTINIPSYVGGHTAFAGFTAGTGGANAEQDIIDWKYTGTVNTGGIPLPTPNFGAGSDCTAGQALLYFNDGSMKLTGYEIDSATNGGAFSKLAGPAASDTSFTVPSLDPTKTYQFRIKALGDGGANADSPFSNTISVTPNGSQPIDFSGGFTGTSGLQLNGNAQLTGSPAAAPTPANALQITPFANGQDNSAYATSEQLINKFDTSFDFVYAANGNPPGEGFAFVIQRDPAGLTAVGTPGQDLGYAGIKNSLAIKFDIMDNEGEGMNSTGLFVKGDSPTTATAAPEENVDLTPSGVMLGTAGDTYHVHLTYDGTTLHQEVTDVTANKTFTHDYKVDIPGVIGDTCGWVGFTGATGAVGNPGDHSEQDITKWTFTGPNGAANIPGDFNGDGKVDFADLLILAQNYGKSGVQPNQGDANGDGKVDFSDLLILAQNYGKHKTAAAPAGSLLSAVVGLVKTR